MNYENQMRPLYVVGLLMIVSGCAVHTQQTAFEVEQFAHSWMNQPFEEFIAYHPEVEGPLQLGNGNNNLEMVI